MKQFKDLKISVKLLTGFIFTAILAATVGWFGINNMQKIDDADTLLYEKATVPLGQLQKIGVAFQVIHVNLRDVLMTTEPAVIDQKTAKIDKMHSIVEEELRGYAKTFLNDNDKQEYEKFKASYVSTQQLILKVVQLWKSGQKEEAMTLMKGDAYVSATKTDELLTKIVELNISAAKEIAENNTAIAKSATTIMTIAVTFCFAVSVWLGLFISKAMTTKIRQVVERMDSLSNFDITNLGKGSAQLAGGDLNINIAVTTEPFETDSKDEIGQLAQSMNKIIINTRATIGSVDKAVEAVKDIINETKLLVDAAVEGKLETRGNASKFRGSYKELVEGLNATFDAIVRPINESSRLLGAMADGDLTGRITADYPGDYGILKDSINRFGDAMCDALYRVTEAVQATASASNEILSGTEQMSAGAQEQSSSAAEVASAVEQMTKTIFENTNNMTRVSETAKVSENIAREGGKVVSDTINGMNRIAEVVTQAAGTVKELGISSNKIGEIVQVIDDI
ncbi:MAG: MCP four helix bundle domain-containing protein, partial [Ignavibacteria bacterium]